MQVVNPWLVGARAVQIGACVLLFGQLVFWLLIARQDALSSRGVRATLGACIAAIALSGVAWLLLVAAALGATGGLDARTAWLVLRATTFGHVWALRAVLVVVFVVALLSRARLRADGVAFVAAAACLASLAWAGHAAAGVGTQRAIELASDVVHLIAAGAWLGALPALAWLLAHERETIRLHHVVRRFSAYGLASVAALVATGVINAWYRVGTVDALLDSDYGRLLVIKLALVAAMVLLAAFNRYLWTPRLVGPQPRALRALRRNTLLETAAGIGVIVVVGLLGVTMPATHGAMQHTMPAMHQMQH